MKTESNMKVVGHELATVNVRVKKGTIEERARLKVKFRGVDGDRKTTMLLVTAPENVVDFPLGEVATISIQIKQGRLALTGSAH